MDEADPARLLGAEALAGKKIAARLARADGAHDKGRDHGRDDAEADLGRAETRRVGGDGDVAGGDEAGPAAQRGAVDHGDRRLGQLVERAQHRLETAGVLEVLGLAIARHAAHPVEIGAGGEALAGAR